MIPTDEEVVFIEDVVGLLRGTYTDPSENIYDFQKPDYVNIHRKKAFEEDIKKNPKLKDIQALPLIK